MGAACASRKTTSDALEAHEVLVVRGAGTGREARLRQDVEAPLVLGPLALRHEDAVGPQRVVALESHAQHSARRDEAGDLVMAEGLRPRDRRMNAGDEQRPL